LIGGRVYGISNGRIIVKKVKPTQGIGAALIIVGVIGLVTAFSIRKQVGEELVLRFKNSCDNFGVKAA
jgi:hypothetical protein